MSQKQIRWLLGELPTLLDEGVLRMVRLAEPFPPLPDTPDNIDILHVTRTWVFVPAGTVRTE